MKYFYLFNKRVRKHNILIEILNKATYTMIIVLLLLTGTPQTAIALSDDQKRVFDSGVLYFDVEEEKCTTGGPIAPGTPGGPVTDYPIRLPYISDSARVADAIDQFILEKYPASPFKDLGDYFVQGGVRAGINPLLVVSHGIQEEQLGTLTGAGIDNNPSSYNSFGRSAVESQPLVPGPINDGWYRYASWQASLYATDFPASGKTEQPDDQFQYIARKFANNLDFGLASYLRGDASRGLPAYTPGASDEYIQNIKDWGNEIAAMSGGAIDLTRYGATDGSGSGTVPVATGSSAKKVVAIDPGHGGAVAEYTDPVTNLGDRETDNSPEREDMQEVANQVKTQLDSSGYTAVLLKTRADEAISKRDRINAAKFVKADLGISLHSDSGSGSFESWAEVWPQFVDGYRQSSADETIKTVFSNRGVADLSNKYSDIFVEERDKAERGGNGNTKKVVGQATYFSSSRGLPSFGDISLIQLWADDIPWVYNESGATSGTGLSADQKQKYATGVVNAVKRAIPTTGSELPPVESCGGAVSGDVVATTLAYAWPYHKDAGTEGATDKKPEYVEAVSKASSRGEYIGGCDGVDCGGFVTRVIRDSGLDPNYNASNCNTGCQLEWARQNWNLIGSGNSISTASLQPGDVAIKEGHTFMWVGTQPGFPSTIASASLCERAPMAGEENPLDSDFEWYRKR